MGSIKEWIRYYTSVWNEEHEKLAKEIASELIWYRPGIRKRILKKIEKELSDAVYRQLARTKKKGK